MPANRYSVAAATVPDPRSVDVVASEAPGRSARLPENAGQAGPDEDVVVPVMKHRLRFIGINLTKKNLRAGRRQSR